MADLRGGGELVVAATPSDRAREALDAMPEVERVRLDAGVRGRALLTLAAYVLVCVGLAVWSSSRRDVV